MGYFSVQRKVQTFYFLGFVYLAKTDIPIERGFFEEIFIKEYPIFLFKKPQEIILFSENKLDKTYTKKNHS